MTTATQTSRIHIENALRGFIDADLLNAATDLLRVLGYESDRTIELSGNVDDFIEAFAAPNPGTQTEERFRDGVRSVKIIFQTTDSEIASAVEAQGMLMDESSSFDKGNARSFIFVAVELRENEYPRGKYSEFTREVNKRIASPAVVLFRTPSNLLTLAFVNRREHKRDRERDVLGSVSLIRNIDASEPHRAHTDILSELSLANMFEWMNQNNQSTNFDGLLNAWLAKLDTQELNKSFYRELFDWFEQAKRDARFPTTEAKTLSSEEHVIRLITRLLFVWFMKEKGLVTEALFNEEQIKPLLNDYGQTSGDSYYRVVLQNLFFGTLNTEIGRRGFSNVNNSTHRDFSRYRYKNEMANPTDLIAWLNETPFINGGLFDCLDTEESTSEGGYRIDCFSDNPSHKSLLSIPNHLFFGQGNERGIIGIFNRYKFTIEENTPAEQEVALDPELLGSVFENLLAAVNPETRESARKKTGSYYTPRPVVDYMVDEALVASIVQKVNPANKNVNWWSDRLHYLLDYNDAGELFEDAEAERVVRAIAELRILDPAAGSGAFPMAVLHKLTLALRRIDPDNRRWEDFQKELAGRRATASFDTLNHQERDAELQEISETFEHYRDSDYGRKLYLIQNSIFGVDVQPIACQIAKLRFFISLAIEQEADFEAENYGIKPLPNLETRFVAANTLLGLGKPMQIPLGGQNKISELNDLLKQNRERHFHATVRSQKLQIRDEDKRLRGELHKELVEAGMDESDAGKISSWDPYDQNDDAPWFDASYMFGLTEGFDVAVGNPPYINVENLESEMRTYLLSNYETCAGRTDIYIAFLEKSLEMLTQHGSLCFILSSAFAAQQYGTKMRQRIVQHHTIRELIDATAYRIFENAVVFNVILHVGKGKTGGLTRVRLPKGNDDFDNLTGTEFLIDQSFFSTLKDCRFDSNPNLIHSVQLKEKIWSSSVRFDQICFVGYGARLNHRSAKIGKSNYIYSAPISGGKPFCEGKNIERYWFSQEGWLDYTPSEHYNPMFPELFENEKLMMIRVVKDQARFAYDSKGFWNSHTVINCVRLDLLTDASHPSAVRALRNADLRLVKRFDYKFLLAVLNSKLTNWYFVNFLGDGLNFYPNAAKQLPIPDISSSEQCPFIRLVDHILEAKDDDPNADTSELEAEIDQLVYRLYGLTDEEIAAVEGNL